MSKKNERMTSPVGVALYPRLTRPDTKFKEEGEYKVDLLLPAKEAKPLMKQLEAMAEAAHKEAIESAKNPRAAAKIKKYQLQLPFEEHINEDGEETGEIKFRFKQKAEIKGKDGVIKMRPMIFDAKLKPITEDIGIGSGTKMRVSFEPSPYVVSGQECVGVTLRLKAVQIIELVEYTGGGSGESYGFEAEDGFAAEDTDYGDDTDNEAAEDDGSADF